MDPKQVEALRKAYNKEHPGERLIPKGPDVWGEITTRLKKVCDAATLACITHALVRKPAAPISWATNGSEWLSSDDIDKSQEYYSELIPNYYYVGSVPIDFDRRKKTGQCLVSSLCSLAIDRLYKKGYRRVGVVFNTDDSDGPGEHWIAAFADFHDSAPTITFFDSYAQDPEPEVQELMRRWKKQLDGMGKFSKPTELRYNDIRHQYGDGQCGMYCIYFLHCCLFNIPMDQKVPDPSMKHMRRLFFEFKDRRSK